MSNRDIWKETIAYFNLNEISDLNWEDIHVDLCGTAVRNRFVSYIIIFLKSIIFKSTNSGKPQSFHIIKKKLMELRDVE